MKTVALISGGKDSCFNMMCCVAEGHNIVALANLRPSDKDELDSYMYQTVGHHAINLYAEAMNLPLYTRIIKGSSVCTDQDYVPRSDDEVEDLYELLARVKSEVEIQAVSVGAILSDYQRVRVENVCQRLNLIVVSYLWRRDQEELLEEMIACDVKAIIIKVAALGLLPKVHLGMELSEILPHMKKMKREYGLNVCGEGGEYETFVLDCPLFKKSLVIDEKKVVMHSDDAFAPVAYLNLKSSHLQTKPWDDQCTLQEKIQKLPITTSKKWLERHLTSEIGAHFDENIINKDNSENSSLEPSVEPELEHLPPLMHSDGLSFEIAGIRGFVSESVDVTMATQQAMNSMMSCVEKLGHNTAEILSMSLYVRNIPDFAAINSVYTTYFKINPPVRLCIQACLPSNVALQLDCQGRQNAEDDSRTMHVQALSHWAPANIGPYSQAVMIGKKLFVAGIVPLIPASLAVIDRGIAEQCKMSLLYVQEILKAMYSSCTLASCPLVTCFVTNCKYIAVAKDVWASSLKESLIEDDQVEIKSFLQFVVVPRLPKNVLVEWQVYAWPFCDQTEDLQIERLFHNHGFYTMTLECCSLQDLFSCRIVASTVATGRAFGIKNSCQIVHAEQSAVDLDKEEEEEVAREESLDKRMIDVEKLANDMLVQYSSLQDCHKKKTVPLAKIFFPMSKFSFSQLEKAFISESSKVASAEKFPVFSFIPVLQLETEQHLLVWCQ